MRFDHNLPTHRAPRRKAFTASSVDRPYDPARDGWNTHVPRHEPSLSALVYRLDDQAADMLEFLD